jgi:hypothetical protein
MHSRLICKSDYHCLDTFHEAIIFYAPLLGNCVVLVEGINKLLLHKVDGNTYIGLHPALDFYIGQSVIDMVIGLTRKVQLFFAGQFVLGQSNLCLESIPNLIGMPVLPGFTFSISSTSQCVFLHCCNLFPIREGISHQLEF